MNSQSLWVHEFFKNPYVVYGGWNDEKGEHISQNIINNLQIEDGAKVYDQCCGRGDLAYYMAKNGIHVTGVDQSEEYIAHARKLNKENENNFFVADALSWQTNEVFDGAVNWHTSIGYGGQNGAIDIIEQLRRQIKPGGRYIIDVRNKIHYKKLSPRLVERFVDADGNDIYIEREGEWRGNMLFQKWTVFKNGEKVQQSDTVCFHPSIEWMYDMIFSCGDSIELAQSNFEQNYVSNDLPRIIFTIQRGNK